MYRSILKEVIHFHEIVINKQKQADSVREALISTKFSSKKIETYLQYLLQFSAIDDAPPHTKQVVWSRRQTQYKGFQINL